MAKFDIKIFALAILFGLVLLTIFSSLFASILDTPELKTGKFFVLVFISVYIVLLFSVAHDWKFDKSEIWLLIFVAITLVFAVWGLQRFMPEIFSAFPQETKELFSAIGV